MPTKARVPKEQKYGTLIVVILIPLVTFIGGTITTAWTYLDKVATKSLLDERFQESLKYTDAKTAQVYQNALEHDDKNRNDMVLRTETLVNELKLRNAVVDTKIEALLKATSEIKTSTERRR
jgi:hypothetical protein